MWFEWEFTLSSEVLSMFFVQFSMNFRCRHMSSVFVWIYGIPTDGFMLRFSWYSVVICYLRMKPLLLLEINRLSFTNSKSIPIIIYKYSMYQSVSFLWRVCVLGLWVMYKIRSNDNSFNFEISFLVVFSNHSHSIAIIIHERNVCVCVCMFFQDAKLLNLNCIPQAQMICNYYWILVVL